MHTEYILKNKKEALVVENNGTLIFKKNHKNLPEILREENKLEQLKESLNNAEDNYYIYSSKSLAFEKLFLKAEKKAHNIKKVINLGMISGLIFFLLNNGLSLFFSNNMLFNLVIFIISVGGINELKNLSFKLVDKLLNTADLYQEFDSLIEKGEKEKIHINYLTNLINKKQKKLNKLNKQRKNISAENYPSKIVNVDNRRELEQQKAYLELMKDSGYFHRIWIKYYQCGILLSKLNEEYNSQKALLMYEYIENNLVPKRILSQKPKIN